MSKNPDLTLNMRGRPLTEADLREAAKTIMGEPLMRSTKWDEITRELLEECRHPLSNSSILAVSPNYTARVIQVAMEMAFSAGVKGHKPAEPKVFRKALGDIIRETYGEP